MKYTTGRVFRQALETRLRKMEIDQGVPLVRLRKQVVFERFLARLTSKQKNVWVLKGGLAMQLRLGIQARTTMDVDLFKARKSGGILSALRAAAVLDMEDYFQFEVSDSGDSAQDIYAGKRFHVTSLVDGRTFEEFVVDVGVDDSLIEPLDCLAFAPVLSFAGIAPTEVPAYSVYQQIAEKLHALTRTYASGISTRVKDLVDILLLFTHESVDDKLLIKAIRITFETRGTHPIPDSLPDLPQSLSVEYGRIARELGLNGIDFAYAQQSVRDFLAPALNQIVLEK